MDTPPLPSNPDPDQSSQPVYQQAHSFYPPEQPGYVPAPPVYATEQPGYPLASAPQKNHIGLWAALAVLLILLGVGGGTIYYLQARSTPQKTLQAYCAAIVTDDAQTLYEMYSSEAQAHISVHGLQQILQIVTLLTGGVKACVVDTNSIQESDPTASGMVTFTANNDRSTRITLHLIDENGQWKIENAIDIP